MSGSDTDWTSELALMLRNDAVLRRAAAGVDAADGGSGGSDDVDWGWIEEVLAERLGAAASGGEVGGVVEAATGQWGDEALAALDDDRLGWAALGLLLETGLRGRGEGEWLDATTGRGGRPMTRDEAGLGTVVTTAAEATAERGSGAEGRSERGNRHWWQRRAG